jgi:hypothetical protein
MELRIREVYVVKSHIRRGKIVWEGEERVREV